MKPLDQFPEADKRALRFVLTDVDDTITTRGRLSPIAYEALANLNAAGFVVIPITGGPAGWCDLYARLWPVDAVIGENGGFYFRLDRDNRTYHKIYAADEETRQANKVSLRNVMLKLREEIPGIVFAVDQNYRETDIAVDINDQVTGVSKETVSHIIQVMKSHGLSARVSSIHVNGWIGNYSKLSMTKKLIQDVYNLDMEQNKDQFIFVGDAPNDQPMFEFFPNSVGVANINRFTDEINPLPAYVTDLEAGAGFAELAEVLLEARSPATV